jgi:hypothetical protein
MIQLDFKNDWKEFLEKEMAAFGFKYDQSKTLTANTIRYLNDKRRILSCKKRKAHESAELCIPSRYSDSYCELKNLISEGGDLKPFLSRETEYPDPKKPDLLLNEWGIHHLHFNPLPDRTGCVLFVRFTDTDAFVIQALLHGNGHSDVWVNTHLIEILHKNWPEIIAGYKLFGIHGECLTVSERKNIRHNHGNVAIAVTDGTCYSSLGGGIVASGRCFHDIIDSDKIIHKLTEWEETVKANESNFRAALKISAHDTFTIKLIIEDQGCWLHDPIRKTRIQVKLC